MCRLNLNKYEQRLRSDDLNPAQLALQFAINSNDLYKGRLGRHQTNLLRVIKRDLKDRNIELRIDWKIIAKCRSYKAGSKSCDLCNTEKLYILKNPDCINKNLK